MSRLMMQHVDYSYNGKDMVLKDVNYQFEDGKIYAITGKSGAGKTTMLSLLSQLTYPTNGTILYAGEDIRNMNAYTYRSSHVGVVFQSFNLLPQLTAVENVVLSMDIANVNVKDKKQHALELLEKTGLQEEEANRRVLKLSGGQQQRVAIARAISYDAQILLADEPTGNLDEDTQEEMITIFQRLAYDEGKCVILVTHSPYIASLSDHTYALISQKTIQRKRPVLRERHNVKKV